MERHHKHPVNVVHVDEVTIGQKAAEVLAKYIGSWRFLIVQSCLLVVWILLNLVGRVWDPYPFILLNLMLSFQAAYTGPILLIAANRQTERDRLLLEHEATEIELERKTLTEQNKLLEQNTLLTEQVHELIVTNNKLTEEIHELVGRGRRGSA